MSEIGFFQKAGFYIEDTAAWIAAGRPEVDETIYNQRKSICHQCDERDPSSDMCRKCGCALHQTVLGDKLRRATSSCPIDNWQATIKVDNTGNYAVTSESWNPDSDSWGR